MTQIVLLLLVLLGTGCTQIEATQATPGAKPALENPSFDQAGRDIPGWAQRGGKFGRARLVTDPVTSAPRALELVAQGKGSSGNNSFMIYQVLDPAAYRGRRVRFGAKIWTRGGAVNMTLYTPEGFGNDFFQDLNSGRYVERSAVFTVPDKASFLSFGIQIMGPRDAKAYIDDVYVTTDESARAPSPSPERTVRSPLRASVGAEVRLRADAAQGLVSPLLFGMHLEWAEAGNGLIDPRTRTLRASVVNALQALHIPLFRFPGGIHADYYNWRGGIGSPDRRPAMTNVFTGRPEPSLFGSSEFVALLQRTGASGLITANYGTGSAAETGAWARYFKDAGASVPYWEVGNEIYLADPGKDQPNGKRISKSGEQYASDFRSYRDAIRAVLPDAKVGLIAHVDNGAFPLAPSSRRDWSSRMLNAFDSRADFVSVHNGYAPVIIDDGVRLSDASARARVYRAMYAAPRQTIEALDETVALLDRKPTTRGLPIAMTEWGPLFGYSQKQNVQAWYVDQSRTMAAAVYVASLLDAITGYPRVILATYTNPVHRWYGSLLTDTEKELVQTPSYYVFAMYRTRFEQRLVPTTVASPTFDSSTVGLVRAQHEVPAVLARAAMSQDGRRLTAMLVNRSLDQSISTRVAFDGFAVGRADCQILAASAPNAINGPSLTDTTVGGMPIAPTPLRCDGDSDMTILLPPSSIVSLVAERR